MAITIAGRAVKVGDMLFHRGLHMWAEVTKQDPSGSMEVTLKDGHRRRTLLVQTGGKIAGRREMFWHEPIELDLPRNDKTMYQEIVNAVKAKVEP